MKIEGHGSVSDPVRFDPIFSNIPGKLENCCQ